MPKTTRRLKIKKNKKFRSSKKQWRKRTNKRMRRSKRTKSRSNQGLGTGSSLPCDPTDKACEAQKELNELYRQAYAQDMLVEGDISPANAAIVADENLEQRQSRSDAETDAQKHLRKRMR